MKAIARQGLREEMPNNRYIVNKVNRVILENIARMRLEPRSSSGLASCQAQANPLSNARLERLRGKSELGLSLALRGRGRRRLVGVGVDGTLAPSHRSHPHPRKQSKESRNQYNF